jgi:hypothetical protein
VKRKFARLKGTGKACDDYAQQHDRRPFVFGFVTEQGTAICRDGSIPVGMDYEFLTIWRKLCDLNNLDAKPVRKKPKVKP